VLQTKKATSMNAVLVHLSSQDKSKMRADIGDVSVSVHWPLDRRLDAHLRMGVKARELTRFTI